MLGRRLVALDDEVVQDETVQVTVSCYQLGGLGWEDTSVDGSGKVFKMFSHQVIQRDSHLWFIREQGRRESQTGTRALTVWIRLRHEVDVPTLRLG